MVLSRLTCTPRNQEIPRILEWGADGKGRCGDVASAMLPCCHADAMLPHRGYSMYSDFDSD